MELKEARIAQRYTQQQVADYLGVSRHTYRKREKNPQLVTIDEAEKLAKLLLVEPEEIFFTHNCN